MNLYPNGELTSSKEYVSLYLHLKYAVSSNFFTNFTLTLLNQSKTEVHRQSFYLRKFVNEQGWGYANFISHGVLTKQVRQGSNITIVLKVRFKRESPSELTDADFSLKFMHQSCRNQKFLQMLNLR
jgi:hypothetical protein